LLIIGKRESKRGIKRASSASIIERCLIELQRGLGSKSVVNAREKARCQGLVKASLAKDREIARGERKTSTRIVISTQALGKVSRKRNFPPVGDG